MDDALITFDDRGDEIFHIINSIILDKIHGYLVIAHTSVKNFMYDEHFQAHRLILDPDVKEWHCLKLSSFRNNFFFGTNVYSADKLYVAMS